MGIVVRSIALTLVLSLLSGPLGTLAYAQQPAAQQPDLMQDALKTANPSHSGTSGAYDVGAGLANVAYVPGKVLVCGLGVVAGVALLVLTVGSGYKAAAAVGEEGCGGKWVLKGDDLRPVQAID